MRTVLQPDQGLMQRRDVNLYDFLFWGLIAIIASLLSYGYQMMHAHWDGGALTVNTHFKSLPYYTLRTIMRLMYGLFFSLLFAFIAGTLAAKNKHAARVILPFINFMESVPLVGFLTFSIVFFMHLYPNNIMGLEYTAIFGVFTGQAWNMALSVYQSLTVVPQELYEVSKTFQLNAWQRYWKIEIPFAIPGLLWNTMVSQSAAWFALVAAEAISVGNKTLFLPGVGSYIEIALQHKDYQAILYAVLALIIAIIIFDKLLFRPLLCWSAKFKFERTQTQQKYTSQVYNILLKANTLHYLGKEIATLYSWMTVKFIQCYRHFRSRFECVKRLRFMSRFNLFAGVFPSNLLSKLLLILWYVFLVGSLVYGGVELLAYLPKFNIMTIAWLMFLTTVRVAIAMVLSLILFVPLGIWIGSSARRTQFLQPIIQVFSALPPNILYPIMAVLLISFHQSLAWWSIPLIMLGTQWYVLFNVISGVANLPQDIRDLTVNFNLRGLYAWRRVLIPAIFPSIVTGIISAAGGAWNADITAEILTWGSKTLSTHGLGAFIASATSSNATSKAALGCVLMCLLVGLCIVFIWRPLYRLAETRYNVR